MVLPDLIPPLDPSPAPPASREVPPRAGPPSLYALTAAVVAAAASWFLLKEFGALLRPLVLAIFLAYLVVPVHQRLRKRVSSTVSATVIILATLVVIGALAMMLYSGVVELNADLPRLIDRVRGLAVGLRESVRARLPEGLADATSGLNSSESQVFDSARVWALTLLSGGASILTEAFVVGVYLIFLLLDLRRFPSRIRAGFGPGRSESVLGIIARINASTTHYLRAKTVASLAAAVPSVIVLWAFGVRHPALWGCLIFFGNFIPYIGSLVAVAFPVLIAFLDLDPLWRPVTVTLALVLIQVVIGYVVEPILMGKAVNLSPLVTLLCLAFWGLCWGLTGMLLAVPLTAMLKIIGENLAYTRPLAVLMGEGDG